MAGTVTFGTSGFVIARQDHIRYFSGDIVHPLLPKVPARFIHDARITSPGGA